MPSPELRRCPFAVGVVVLGPDAPVEDRQTARLAVAVAAYEQGYHLLDLVEAPGGLDGKVVGRLWELAAGVEAQALFVHAAGRRGRAPSPCWSRWPPNCGWCCGRSIPPPRGAETTRDRCPAWPGGRGGARSVLGLQIPADAGRPVRLTMVRPTVPALSEALGGGLPTEALTWRVDGSGYTFYLDRHRVDRALPGNGRAAVLAARLGHVTRTWLAGLRGDVLVLGCDERRQDVSVPRSVVDAAARSGLFGPDVDVRAWTSGDVERAADLTGSPGPRRAGKDRSR